MSFSPKPPAPTVRSVMVNDVSGKTTDPSPNGKNTIRYSADPIILNKNVTMSAKVNRGIFSSVFIDMRLLDIRHATASINKFLPRTVTQTKRNE